MTQISRTIAIESEKEKEQYENSYLHLHTIGYDVKPDHDFSYPGPLSDYLITVILDGNGFYWNDNNKRKKRPYTAGDLLVFQPGEYFHIRKKGNLKRLWFHALGTAIPEILTTIPLDATKSSMNLSVEQRNIFSELFDELFTCAKAMPFHSTKLNAMLLTLLASVSNSADFKRQSDSLSAIIEYINTNYQKEIPIQTLAELAHLNPYYLIKQFKKAYGLTPHQYILRKRFNAVTTELINTNTPIDEIAMHNGFCNRTHLSQMFKKHYGVSPSEYRKKY